VYASRPASPPGSRNTRFQAARYALPGLDFHQLIAPTSWRTSIRATSPALVPQDLAEEQLRPRVLRIGEEFLRRI
jgi:hypothetical protein